MTEAALIRYDAMCRAIDMALEVDEVTFATSPWLRRYMPSRQKTVTLSAPGHGNPAPR